MYRKIIAISILFILIFSFSGLALTADEYYDRAAKKYVMGNLEGAAIDLNNVLAFDPEHQKAKDLLNEVIRELGIRGEIKPPPPPPSKPKPKPKPKPPPRRPVKKIVKPKIPKEVKALPFTRGALIYKVVNSPELLPLLLIGIGLAFAILIKIFFVPLKNMVRKWKSQYTYCKECNARNKHETEFCRKCGSRLIFPLMTKKQEIWFNKFNWSKNPFTLDIRPSTYAGHKGEISIIMDKINTRSGHILIIGGLGTGKTTLLRLLEKNLKGKYNSIYIVRPPQRFEELIDLVSATITGQTAKTRKYSLYEFQTLCIKYKGVIVLLLDEAHEFSEGFEQFLRTLGDLNNVILVMGGLPQTREKLKRELPALFDRIVESILLGALSADETHNLIENRIADAGGSGLGPFTMAAVDKIVELSYGIPRGILKLCDWAVTQAIRDNRVTIDAGDFELYRKG